MKPVLRRGVFVGLAIVTLQVGAVASAEDDAEHTTPCPAVAEWKRAHAEQLPIAAERRDKARTLGEPALVDELRQRTDEDQRVRRASLAKPSDRAIAAQIASTDASNLAWLKNLLLTHGFPTVEQIGEIGLHNFWLLVQHADRDPTFQQNTLAAFTERFAAGELSADDFAKITDRVLVSEGRPQKYGTQFDWRSGAFNPKNVENVTDIDARRLEIGLMPLNAYACMMNSYIRQLK